MALRDEFNTLRGKILHRVLSLQLIIWLMSCSPKWCSWSLVWIRILLTHNPSIFAVSHWPNNHHKTQATTGYNECSFCKHKDHFKAQCPKLLNKAQSSLHWKFRNQAPRPPHVVSLNMGVCCSTFRFWEQSWYLDCYNHKALSAVHCLAATCHVSQLPHRFSLE